MKSCPVTKESYFKSYLSGAASRKSVSHLLNNILIFLCTAIFSMLLNYLTVASASPDVFFDGQMKYPCASTLQSVPE